jgi:hypothetical protein
MTNQWVEHCRAYAKKNNCSYRDAMSKAKTSYHRKRGSGIQDISASNPPTEPKGIWCFFSKGDLSPINRFLPNLHGGASMGTKILRKVKKGIEPIVQPISRTTKVWGNQNVSSRTDIPLMSIGKQPPALPYITYGKEVRSDGTYDVVTTTFYYPDNPAIGLGWQVDPYNKKLGYHDHDIEFVSIYYMDGKPIKVFFSQHSIGKGWGAWRAYEDCQIRDGFLVDYVARNSHANYPDMGNNGTHARIYYVGNDVTDASGPNAKFMWGQMRPSFDWSSGGIVMKAGLREAPPDDSISSAARLDPLAIFHKGPNVA